MGIKRTRAMIYKHKTLNVYICKKDNLYIKLLPNGVVITNTSESLKGFYPTNKEGYITMLKYIEFRVMSVIKSNRLTGFTQNFNDGSVSYYEAGELPMGFTSFSGVTVLQLDCQSDISNIEKQYIHDGTINHLSKKQFETFFNDLK